MNTDWMSRRQRALHMTIRAIDFADFDVPAMIDTYRRWSVTLFSFFAGGYVTTYPSSLPWARIAPQLGGRDLCREILTASHAAGIRTFPAVDLGEMPSEVADRHPDWAARNPDGSMMVRTEGIIAACPTGPYMRDCSREMVVELVQRYGGLFDGIKWGGGSYGFPVCQCQRCRAAYLQDTGEPMPADSRGETYARWRQARAGEAVRYLVDMVHDVADVPVMGNSVWHLGRGMEIDDFARDQDFVQVEIQTRTTPMGDDDDPAWERFSTPIETTRYVSRLTRRPPWVVASYFLAWPWRRVAVPVAEQKVYLAQVAANGGSPMVNMTNGSPKHHQDQRGFAGIEQLYGFMARNADLYEQDESAATVAIICDPESAALARRLRRDYKDYLHDLHGCEDALDRLHIPYDLVSSSSLADIPANRYAALLVPSPMAIGDAAVGELARLSAAGVGLVVTGNPAAFAGDTPRQDRTAICSLLRLRSIATPRPLLAGRHTGPTQAYARIAASHAVVGGVDAPLVAIAGPWCPTEPLAEAEVPLRRMEPFRLFPEGMAYPDRPDPDEPLCIAGEGAGRTVYFPFPAGRCAARTGHPDNDLLIANAIGWAGRGILPARLEGWPDVRLSVRRQGSQLLVHLINTTGRRRYLTQPTPLHDLRLHVARPTQPSKAWLAATREELSLTWQNGWTSLVVPTLTDYDVVVVE